MWKNAFSFQGAIRGHTMLYQRRCINNSYLPKEAYFKKKKRLFLLCDRTGNKSVACQVKQTTDVIVAPRGLHTCFLFSPPFPFWLFVNKKKDEERERDCLCFYVIHPANFCILVLWHEIPITMNSSLLKKFKRSKIICYKWYTLWYFRKIRRLLFFM